MSLNSNVLHQIEFPVEKRLRSRRLSIDGWCFDKTGELLRGVRAKVGGKSFVAQRKRPRPYLGYRYPDHPEAALSGFQIQLVLPRGKSKVVLECKRQDKKWHPFEELDVVSPWFDWPWTGVEKGQDYNTWVVHYDTLDEGKLQNMRSEAAAMASPPLISILVPVYNPPVKWLRRSLDSVLSQVYPHWELCVADDASTDPQVPRVLREYANKDSRIKLVERPANGHIVAASNSALALATGTHIALLDHDDELRPHALWQVAQEIQAFPEVDLIYSDEDHLDEDGQRCDPYFKPDFNYDLLLSQNFICHLGVYRTSLVREIGGFREESEGAQDWDLALRVVENSQARRIRHISKVLYHWRRLEGSTAKKPLEKPYALEAGRKAVEGHLKRTGQGFDEVTATQHGHVRIRRPLAQPPQVTIIIPTRNFGHLLRICVESVLARTDYPSFEILIVDNDSDEPATLALLEQYKKRPNLRVLKVPGPFNYSLLNNEAVAVTSSPVLCLLNNDIEIHEPDWLREMVSQAVREDIGAVGTKLLYPDGRVQHAGVILGMGAAAGHLFKGTAANNPALGLRLHVSQNFLAVTAACLVVERKKYLAVGGLDDTVFKVAFNDIDFCLKLFAAGYRNLYTPFAEMSHHESASRGEDEKTPSRKAKAGEESKNLIEKWTALFEADPAYNINLSGTAEDGSLSFPPRSVSRRKGHE